MNGHYQEQELLSGFIDVRSSSGKSDETISRISF